MKWFLAFSILITLSSNILAKRWNTNKDSIIVDAQYNSEEVDRFQSDDVMEKAECYTSDGEPGECVTMVRCHKILFSEKGQLRNSGLALTYAQSDDVCASRNNLDGSNKSENKPTSEGAVVSSQIGQKVICCSKDRIQYDLRSELDQELDTYTTTLPSSGDPILPTTGSGGNVVLEDVTLSPSSVNIVGDEVVVVESENNFPAVSSEPIVDVQEIETVIGTTFPPQQQQSVEPVAEPESEAETNTPASITTSPEIHDLNEGQQVSNQPDIMDHQETPTSACPSTNTYGPWPVFNDYPWLATIQTKAKTGPTCSGSLITESHVLSAAHCIHRFNSRDVARMQIRIGFTKRSTNDTFNDYYILRNASKIIFHKRFHEQSKMDNNIAIIKLDQPVEFDDHISPISVFNQLDGFDVGNCSAAEAGWIKFGNRRVTGISDGVIKFVEPPMSDFHLRESLSDVLNREDCNNQLNSQINEKMLCAKTTLFEEPSVSTDFFRWNDGGPLVVKVGNTVQQIGIKSWAYEGQQYPTVYTRVDSYLDWIRNNLKM